MLSRASARVDENSRRRMKRAREYELRNGNGRDRAARTQITSSPSSIKGKGKGKGKERAKERIVTRSMDELGDHTNLLRFRDDAHQFSSLPIMETKDPSLLSQPGPTVQAGTDADEDVYMNVDDPRADVSALPPGNRHIKPPVSTHVPKNKTRRLPPHPSTTTHSQKPARAEAPSPTPRQPSGHLSSLNTTAVTSRHHHHHHHHNNSSHHPIPVPTPLLPLSAATATAAAERSSKASKERPSAMVSYSSTSQPLPSSQAHGLKRALGMTRSSVPRSSSPHSAAVKKPFRPPLARATTPIAAHGQHEPKSAQQRQEDKKSSAADPDSSFDISFDFDPEALEAAMRKFD